MLTQQALKQALSYDRNSGSFVWIKKNAKGVKAGTSAGSNKCADGYARIKLFGQPYMAHRLAWFYENGHWPDNLIDHINGNKMDNRMINLRDVTHSVNLQNQRGPRSNNKSGFLGVKAHNWGWMSQIKNHKQTIFLGTFATPELAHAAYVKAKRIHHAGCTI